MKPCLNTRKQISWEFNFMIILKRNTTYIRSGNLFSRAFLVRDNFWIEKKLAIFDTEAELKNFQKCYNAITTNTSIYIQKPFQTALLFFSSKGMFLATKEIFEFSIPDTYKYEKCGIFLQIGKSSPGCILIYSFVNHIIN